MTICAIAVKKKQKHTAGSVVPEMRRDWRKKRSRCGANQLASMLVEHLFVDVSVPHVGADNITNYSKAIFVACMKSPRAKLRHTTRGWPEWSVFETFFSAGAFLCDCSTLAPSRQCAESLIFQLI